uniref:MMS19 nucleotide excision repair protein n=1 Tax=Rhodnius prolixus TaxID=13249 RepID=T1HTH2_RHOPR
MSIKTLLLYGETEDFSESELHIKAVKEIISGDLTILELVGSLGSHLTSTDEEKRRQGVLLLVNIIKNLPANHLNENEVYVLSQFFCDRLKDRLTIIPAALMGLESISLMENVNDNVPSDVMTALSMNITAQTLMQSSRLTYYTILKNLIFNKSEVLLRNSSDFVYGVISAIDSESDPRCLIYLFQFLPRFLSQFPLGHLTEEAFSVLECYFPIDFNPRDKTGVTREDLAKGLQDCLLSTPVFAPFIIPVILEKLASQLKVAHLDSLNLLIKGMEIWSVQDIKPHITDIWRSLNKLILPPSENEVAELAVQTLVAIITKFIESNSANRELDQLLDDISASTHSFLSDPSLSLFLPATKLLAAVSQVCDRSCEFVIKMVLGQLLVLLEQSSGRDITLSALCPILNASVKFNCWKNAEERQNIYDIILEAVNSDLTSSDRELCIKADKKVLIIFGTECEVPYRLLTFALNSNTEEETIVNISKIIQDILRTLNSSTIFFFSQQKVLLNNCLSQFLPPDSKDFPTLKNSQLFLLEGLVCPLRQDVSINMCESLVTSLIDSSVNNESYRARESASIILASIINKYQSDNSYDMPVNAVLNTVENGKQKEIILLLSWTAKSLIMRNHSQANCFLDKIICSLKINDIQMEAAESFKLILAEHESLSLINYCTIKLLYKQRIFHKLNDLISLLEKAEGEHKVAILLAVAYILQNVPMSLVNSKLSEMIPIMVQCFDCTSSVVITVILEILASLLESGEQMFEQYIDTFIPRCLRCVQSSSMVVRMQALNCIYYYGKFKEVSILPHRDKVLSGLEKSLDDKKRMVRQKAVRARNRWYLVGGLPDR